MRDVIVAAALAGALFGGLIMPTSAQDGVIIQNNGVDSVDSAAGASNVNVSLAAGNSSSVNGPGVNNEAGYVVKERNRNRKNRESRTNDGGGEAAPMEAAPTAPTEGDYQTYTEEGDWVEPVVPAQELVAEPMPETIDPNLPVQLPNTGAGGAMPLAPLVMGAVASALGAFSVRLRRPN